MPEQECRGRAPEWGAFLTFVSCSRKLAVFQRNACRNRAIKFLLYNFSLKNYPFLFWIINSLIFKAELYAAQASSNVGLSPNPGYLDATEKALRLTSWKSFSSIEEFPCLNDIVD